MLRRLTRCWPSRSPFRLADPGAEAPPAAVKDGVSLQDIRTFTAGVPPGESRPTWRTLERRRADAAAIKGLLSGLDPHSEYLDQRELTRSPEDTSGAYEGLGIEVFSADGVLRVIAPIDDHRAGERAIAR